MATARRVYLDHSATTPVRPEAVAALERVLSVEFGNPSSPHAMGLEAERRVREAREALAAVLGVDPDEILFTSGGTEANNLALRGAARAHTRHGRHLVTTAVEHSSVLETMRDLEREGFALTVVPVDGHGRVRAEDVLSAVRDDTVLVSVMYVNNEVGAVQPVAEIGRELARRRGGGRVPLVHVDAVQALGKLPVEPRRLGADLLTVSGHKVHGPKGVGALYVRRGVALRPLLAGGDQQGGLRPGTENVPGIVAFGVAARLAARELEETRARLEGLRRRLLEGLRGAVPDARVNSPEDGAPHILSVAIPGVRGETLVHALAERGVMVSTGSACHSRRAVVSHVLQAMGLERRLAEGTIRVSMGRDTTAEDVDRFLDALREAVAELRAVTARC